MTINDSLYVDVVEVCGHVAGKLNEAIVSITSAGKPGTPSWSSLVLVVYFAIRIYRAFASALFQICHGFDLDAQFHERALYEYFVKMIYYGHFKDRADATMRSGPKKHLRLVKRLLYDPEIVLTPEILAFAATVGDVNWDDNFKQMRLDLVNDSAFVKRTDYAAKFVLQNTDDRWRMHWVIPSQVVHGTLMDLFSVVRPEDGVMNVSLDSNLPGSIGRLLDMCQFPINTVLYLRDSLGAVEPSGLNDLAKLVSVLMNSAESLDKKADGAEWSP